MTEQHEMKGPSLINGMNPENLQETLEKLQNDPRFAKMMEENKIKAMNPRDRLRAKLKQKQDSRKPKNAQ